MLTLGCNVLSDRCLPARRKLTAYIAHVSNIYSDVKARAKTYVDDRNRYHVLDRF